MAYTVVPVNIVAVYTFIVSQPFKSRNTKLLFEEAISASLVLAVYRKPQGHCNSGESVYYLSNPGATVYSKCSTSIFPSLIRTACLALPLAVQSIMASKPTLRSG